MATKLTSKRKPRAKEYTLQCCGERHHVAITRHGLVFENHAADEVWNEKTRAQALAVFSGEQIGRPLGCFEIAALVRERRYVAPGVPAGGARQLLAALRGVQAFRSATRRSRKKVAASGG